MQEKQPKIKFPLEPDLSNQEKLKIRTGSYFSRLLKTFILSGLISTFAGKGVQNLEREATGFDPNEYSELSLAKEKRVEKEKEYEYQNFFQKMFRKLRNPIKVVEDNYEDLKFEYYKILNFIDNVSFILPAIIVFIPLARFVSGKLKGDPVAKAINQKLVNHINYLNTQIEALKKNQLTKVELEKVRSILREAGSDLKEADEIINKK